MYFCQIPILTGMHRIKHLLPLLLLFPVLFSCNKDLNVDAGWKDITVVYGLLDQSSDTTFIKVTKAFLGPGDAMTFAKIADSSNYPDKLDVRLNEYSGTDSIASHSCDTVTIHYKSKGDSIFYYPDQLMYFSKVKLNENHTYKLVIKNKKTGKLITAQPEQTNLIHDFEVTKPQPQVTIGFDPGKKFEVRWYPAKNGKRYQLVIRFFYKEYRTLNPVDTLIKSIDWVVTNNIVVADVQTTQPFDEYYPADGFYNAVGIMVDTTSILTRVANHCEYIFSVADVTLNTYMEVTEPSTTIAQEKPSYTNIVNGLGLFSARYTKKVDSLYLSKPTQINLNTSEKTKNRGFIKLN